MHTTEQKGVAELLTFLGSVCPGARTNGLLAPRQAPGSQVVSHCQGALISSYNSCRTSARHTEGLHMEVQHTDKHNYRHKYTVNNSCCFFYVRNQFYSFSFSLSIIICRTATVLYILSYVFTVCFFFFLGSTKYLSYLQYIHTNGHLNSGAFGFLFSYKQLQFLIFN